MKDKQNVKPLFSGDQEREIDALTMHGVFLEMYENGVLLTGESGIGKSELALELVTRNHSLIADDAPEFSRPVDGTVQGTCPDILRDFLMVQSLGVLNIRAMYGDSAIKDSQVLCLIVHLKKSAGEKKHKTGRQMNITDKRNILGVEIPVVTLPVDSGRNLAVLIEGAVRHHILLRKGYNAPESFIERQQEAIHQQSPSE